MTIRHAAFSAIRWTSMAMLGRAAIAFAQIVTLSRILDPADFRQVAIAVTIVGIGIVFTDMGISSALIRFRDVTKEELNSLFWLNVFMGGVVTLVVAAGSPLIAMFYGDMRLVPLVLVASTVFFVTALGQQQRAMAEKNLRFDVLFKIDMASAIAGFSIAVISALAGFGAMSIVVGNLVNVAGVTVLSWLLLADGWRPSFSFSWKAAKRFVAFGSNVVAISMFNAVALNGDIVLGGRLITGSALGYYFQPRDLCLRIMLVVNPIVTRVSFPLLSSVAHDKERVKSVYLKAMRMTASVNFPIYAFLAVFGPEVVAIALGPKWAASGPIMRVLAAWGAVRSVGNPVGSLLFATGETKRATYSALSVAIAVFVFVYLGAPFGILGIPTALTILYVILIPVFWIALVRPSCGASFAEYHTVLLLPAIATLCAALVGALVLQLVDGALPRLVIGGAAGTLVYLASSWLINREWLLSMAELLMIKRLLRGRPQPT
ncbi:MOP flippase family protein [Labrys miyagiensis]|nr:MOP flippase family protein [Labrys miyagiensis]